MLKKGDLPKSGAANKRKKRKNESHKRRRGSKQDLKTLRSSKHLASWK